MEPPPHDARAGALVLIGGGGTPPEVYDLFFRLAGGPEARIVHIPSSTSTFHEIEDRRDYYGDFYGRNPASFEFLHADEREEAEAEGFASPLSGATGAWIGGGNQNRLASLFAGTEVVPALRGVLRRGGVVAGTSSGASIASERMICFGYTEAEVDRGFALWPGTIVDAHFSQRLREHRLAHAVLQHPECVGVGVDERLALVVRGDRLEAVGVGDGSVWFYVAEGGDAVVRFRLAIGESFRLDSEALASGAGGLRKGLLARGGGVPTTMGELFEPWASA